MDDSPFLMCRAVAAGIGFEGAASPSLPQVYARQPKHEEKYVS
jgi:hypothetical protein